MVLYFKLHTDGCEPQRMSNGDAGYDLRAAEDVSIGPGGRKAIPLGVAFQIPKGTYGMLTHRSSLAFKKGCTLSLGIIDSNFTGEVKAFVFNHDQYFRKHIKKGERIAQIIFIDYNVVTMNEVESLPEGKGGFGSSGEE